MGRDIVNTNVGARGFIDCMSSASGCTVLRSVREALMDTIYSSIKAITIYGLFRLNLRCGFDD